MCTVLLPPCDNPIAFNKYIKYQYSHLGHKGMGEIIHLTISSTAMCNIVKAWHVSEEVCL